MWQEEQRAVVPSCLSPASSFLLTKEQLEMGGTRTSRCPEQVHRRKRLCLGSFSRDHQLGLVLRSMWDIEIPDCP